MKSQTFNSTLEVYNNNWSRPELAELSLLTVSRWVYRSKNTIGLIENLKFMPKYYTIFSRKLLKLCKNFRLYKWKHFLWKSGNFCRPFESNWPWSKTWKTFVQCMTKSKLEYFCLNSFITMHIMMKHKR